MRTKDGLAWKRKAFITKFRDMPISASMVGIQDGISNGDALNVEKKIYHTITARITYNIAKTL